MASPEAPTHPRPDSQENPGLPQTAVIPDTPGQIDWGPRFSAGSTGQIDVIDIRPDQILSPSQAGELVGSGVIPPRQQGESANDQTTPGSEVAVRPIGHVRRSSDKTAAGTSIDLRPTAATPAMPGAEVAVRPKGHMSRAADAMSRAAEAYEGIDAIRRPRDVFMPKPKAEKHKTPIHIKEGEGADPVSAQIYGDAARKDRKDLVGLTWTGDGATFRVSSHSVESRESDHFDIKRGGYHNLTNDLHDRWRGADERPAKGGRKAAPERRGAWIKNRRWHGLGVLPPVLKGERYNRHDRGHHESMFEQMRGFSPSRTNAFATGTNGFAGFQFKNGMRDGPGFYGVTTVESKQERLARRTVEVIRDGQVTRMLDFGNDAELIKYLNDNHGNTESSLGFKDFAWEDKPAAPGIGKDVVPWTDRPASPGNAKDIIPVRKEEHTPVSLAAVEESRRALGLKDRTGLTWTETARSKDEDGTENVRPRKSQIVREYTVSKRPNNYTAHEVLETHIEVQTEHTNAKGKVFKRSIIFTPEGLQRHFDALEKGTKKDDAPVNVHWELDQLPETDMQGRILRQEAIAGLDPKAETHPLTAETFGRFATALVVERPSRDKETDPGLTDQEALGLLLSPDKQPEGWEDRVRAVQSGEGGLYDTYRSTARNLKATVDELGSGVVGETADAMLKELQSELTRLGMKEEADKSSISWAYSNLADIYMRNRGVPAGEAHGEPLDPFEMSKSGHLIRQELIDMGVAEVYAARATKEGMVRKESPDGPPRMVKGHVYNSDVTKLLPPQIQDDVELLLSMHQPGVGEPLKLGQLVQLGNKLRFGWADTEEGAKNLRARKLSEKKPRI